MSTSVWEQPGTLASAFWKNGKAGIPIYDMHSHMGPHNAIYLRCHDAASMAAHVRRIGVKRVVFAHHCAMWGAMRNAEDYRICQEYPDLYRMYVAINPNFPEYIREDLALFDRWQPYAVGLKFLPSYQNVSVLDPKYEYALKFAEERGLLCLFHTWGSSPTCNGPAMLKLTAKYSRLKFLLGHSIHGDFDSAIRCVKESSGNVYLELTAIPGETGIIEKLVDGVGSEKILYGTDMPWFDEYQAVGGVVSAKITENDMHNILYRNAQKLLGE